MKTDITIKDTYGRKYRLTKTALVALGHWSNHMVPRAEVQTAVRAALQVPQNMSGTQAAEVRCYYQDSVMLRKLFLHHNNRLSIGCRKFLKPVATIIKRWSGA